MAKRLLQIEVTGTDAVTQAMSKAGDRYEQATAAALYQKGFEIDRDMVFLVPVDTGRLRNSHYVAPPRGRGRNMFVEIGVGTDYAAAVHERHPTQSKFLENALRKHAGGMRQDLKRKIARNYSAGVGVDAVPLMAPKRPEE